MSEKRKYRQFTPEQKTEVVLAGLRGDRSVRDVCREYEISETLYYSWRDKLLEGGKAALAASNARSPEHVEAAELQARVARRDLAVELRVPMGSQRPVADQRSPRHYGLAMRAEIRSISSSDVEDLDNFRPSDDVFSVPIRLQIGPAGAPGEESFDLTVCSVLWLDQQVEHARFRRAPPSCRSRVPLACGASLHRKAGRAVRRRDLARRRPAVEPLRILGIRGLLMRGTGPGHPGAHVQSRESPPASLQLVGLAPRVRSRASTFFFSSTTSRLRPRRELGLAPTAG